MDHEKASFRRNARLQEQATADAKAIISMITGQYQPRRVFQWGSLLRPGAFKPYSDIETIAELDARIEKTMALLTRVGSEYDGFLRDDFERMGRKNTSAMVLAELIVDYYTCLETCFLRISQFFENHLSDSRWHADLLEKMTLRIEGTRDAVISDTTAAALSELMKFRHFRRYYFELEYDWDKLEYLQKVFARVRVAVPGELATFQLFLHSLAA